MSFGRQKLPLRREGFALVYIALSVVILLAFEGAAAELVQVDEILVSSREDRPVVSNGRLTVLQGSKLNSKTSQTMADVLREVTGLDISQNGGSGQPSSVFIRGAKSEHTLVLIDGIEATDSTTTTRFFDFSSLSVENIERIEIHRGASSVRFGADAIGGVINIITRKGSGPDKREISGELGTYQTRRLSAANWGAKSNFNYSASISLFSTEGFSAAEAGETAESDKVNRTTASLRFGWRLETVDDLSFTFRVNETDTKLDAGGGVAGDDPNYDSQARQFLGGVTYTTSRLIPSVTSVFAAAINSTNRRYLNLPDAIRSDDYRETFQSENYKFETRQTHQVNAISNFEALLQYRLENGKSDQSFNAVSSRLGREEQSVLGTGLIYDVDLSGLNVTTGVRYDRVSTSTETILSSSISAMYEVDSTKTSFQTGYGSGFKNPSLFQLYSNFGSRDLRSERAETVDVSVEQKVGSASSVRLSYFHNRYSNLIDFDLAASKYSNILNAKSEGIELELASFLTERLEVKLAGKGLRARDDSTGLDLLRRPARSYVATITWLGRQWQSSLTSRLVGERDDLDPVSFQRIRLPRYATVDATLQWVSKSDLRVSLRLENIGDAIYQDVAGYRSPRRAVYLSISRLWSQSD